MADVACLFLLVAVAAALAGRSGEYRHSPLSCVPAACSLMWAAPSSRCSPTRRWPRLPHSAKGVVRVWGSNIFFAGSGGAQFVLLIHSGDPPARPRLFSWTHPSRGAMGARSKSPPSPFPCCNGKSSTVHLFFSTPTYPPLISLTMAASTRETLFLK